jgi:MFS superfamily sulfate permease-like transporter
VDLAVWLALLSGALQAALGLARFGWLLNLVNSPVLTAFTQAAAVLIVSSQLPALLGLAGGWTGCWRSRPSTLRRRPSDWRRWRCCGWRGAGARPFPASW